MILPPRELKSAHHFKPTPQRQFNLAVLEESQEHLGAEDLIIFARTMDVKTSLTTFYPILAVLKKIVFIQEKAQDKDHSYFVKVTIEPHFHLTCTLYERVVDLHSKRIEQQMYSLCAKQNLQSDHIQLLIHSLCRECTEE